LAATLPGRELLPPDEPRFAMVGREMYRSGDFVSLTRGGHFYADKPPLLFWAQTVFFSLWGEPSETPARLPSLLACLALVALVHRAGRRWLGDAAGTAAPLVLISFWLIFWQGAWVSTDMSLSAAVFAALLAWDVETRSKGWSGRCFGFLGGLCLGLACLAKGPVAIVHLALAGLGLRLGKADIPVRRGPPRFAFWLGFAVCVAPWVLLFVERHGAKRLGRIFWHQNIERFWESWDNLEPFWYHPPYLLLGLMPWGLVLLGGCFFPSFWRPIRSSPTLRGLLAWIGLSVLFFSIPEGKRSVYLMPAYPAVALLIAGAWPAWRRSPAMRRTAALLLLGGAMAMAGVWIGMGFGVGPAAALGASDATASVLRRGVAAVAAVTVTTWTLTAVGLWAGRRAAIFGPSAWIAALAAVFPFWLTPALNASQGGRTFAETVRPLIPQDAALAYTREKWEIAAWNLDRPGLPLRKKKDVADFLKKDGARAVIGARDWLEDDRIHRENVEMISVGRLGTRPMALLLKRPDRTNASVRTARPGLARQNESRTSSGR